MATFHNARRNRKTDDDDSGGGMWIPGLGENKPRPRELGCTMFGYIPDAFQNNLPQLPSESARVAQLSSSSKEASATGSAGSDAASTVSSSGSGAGDGGLGGLGGAASSRSNSPCSRPETADDSSQMRDALFQPPSPPGGDARGRRGRQEAVVVEEVVTAVDAGAPLVATPFFGDGNKKILIKGGTVVNCDGAKVSDVFIADGVIAAVGDDVASADAADAMVIDASGKFVLPGGIDPATHFRSSAKEGVAAVAPADDFSSGTRAALAGGTTLVVDTVEPARDASLVESLGAWAADAEENACCDFAFRVAVPKWGETTKEEMAELVKKEGVNTFKVFMCYKDICQLTTAEIAEVMETAKELGAVVAVHAENGDVIKENEKRMVARGMVGPEAHLMSRPEETEEEAVTRALALARQVNVPVVLCGPTSRGAIDAVAKVRAKTGVVAWTEATAAALAADGRHYYNGCWEHAAGFVTAPPLRDDPGAPDAITKALADDVYQMVASDHRGYSREAKAAAGGKGSFVNIPHGLGGAEERLAVVWEKGVEAKMMEPERAVAVTSANAAKALGLYPQKGRVAVGSDADVVVWNANNLRQVSARSHAQRGDFNALEGVTLHGAPEFVVCGGRVAVYEYQLSANLEGKGKRVRLEARPSALYDAVDDVARSDAAVRPVDRSGGEQVTATTAGVADLGSAAPDFGLTTPRKSSVEPVMNAKLGIYQRPMSAHGVRNQQDSTFSLSTDVSEARRASVRVNAPPGGGGKGFW